MKASLFLRILGQEIRTRLSYRIDFWLNTFFGFLTSFGIAYFVWDAMFRESGSERIGGMTFEEMVAYYLAVIVLGRFVSGRDLEATVSGDIYEGGLNRYLLFPAPYLPFKYAQSLGMMLPAALPFMLLGAIVLAFIDVPPEARPTPASVAMAVPAVVLANLLHYLMSFPIQLVAFWADNVWSLDVAKRFALQLLGGMMIPLTVFPEWAQQVLFFIPFPYFFFFPARVLLGQVSPGEWAAGLGVALAWCVLFAGVSRIVWHRGQLQYSGVGI